MKVRHQFDLASRFAEAQKARQENNGPTLTHQGPKADADINRIVARYGIDKIPVPPQVMDPSYYGETDFPDLSTALHATRNAQERFRALPAALRQRFSNDPGELWDFVSNPANLDEAVALGLLRRSQAPETPSGTAPAVPPSSPEDKP